MNHRIKAAVFTSILCLNTPAWGAGSHYAGIGMGGFSVGDGIQSKTAFGGYLQLGHNFNEWMGAEVRLGATSGISINQPTAAKERVDFVAHFLKPYFKLYDDFTLYALGGFAVTHASYQPTGGSKQTKNRISYAYGLGAEYQLNDDYSLAMDVWHMNSKPKNSAATIGTSFAGLEASAYTATLRYNF